MKFKKQVLKVGEYKSPDGNVIVTPERMKHWEEQFKKMKLSGLKIPVPWGHQSISKPRTYEEKEYWESKFNAGYIDEIKAKDGELEVILDIPRPDDSDKIGKSVQEVSPQIETAWRDGKGRIWNDVITHLALVTHPVVDSQENFEAIDDPLPQYAMRLSLKNYITKLDTKEDKDMASDQVNKTDPKENEVESVEEETPKETEEKPGESETPETPLETETPIEGAAGSGETGDMDSDLQDGLAAIGLMVPESSFANPQAFKTALLAAVLTMKHKIDELGGEGEDEHAFKDLNLPEEGKNGQDTGEEENENMNNPGQATPSGTDNSLQEQQPQYSMSLKKIAHLEKRLEESDKARMNSEVNALLETGRITPVIAQKLKQDIGSYRLSLNADGEASMSVVAAKIEDFKLMPEGSAWSSDEKVRLRNVGEESLPSEFTNLNDVDAEALAEKQLRASGRGIALGV